MGLKTTAWDSAEYLKTEADIAAYLDACFEEGGDDPAFLAHALGVAARARNMSQLARDSGLTREGLYKALSRDGNPSFGTVLKVADAMGYRFALVGKAKKKVAGKKVAKAAKPASQRKKQSRLHA
jgi:probable addiction module antidote protein